MDLHANAVLTVRQRRRLCDLVSAGLTITAAALVVGCSRQTASKWVNRRRSGQSLHDRSSRPRRSPKRTPAPVEQAILRAREELREGPHVIGWALGIAASTVHAVLSRHGRSRLQTKLSREEIIRYERSRPGELVHVDCKRLGRIVKPGHRVTGDRSSRAQGTTITPGSASPRATPTRRPTARPPSSPSSFASTWRTGSSWSVCSPTMAPASSAAGRSHVQRTGSRCARPAPTAHKQTARPSASYAHCSSAGHTPIRTRTSQSDTRHSHRRSTLTIASVPTALSEASRRCSASTTSLGHTPSPGAQAALSSHTPELGRACDPARGSCSSPPRGRTRRIVSTSSAAVRGEGGSNT